MRIWAVSLAIAGLVTAVITAASGLTLAQGGEAQVPIVIANDPTELKRLLADDLAAYLGKIAGAECKVMAEDEGVEAPAIWVGITQHSEPWRENAKHNYPDQTLIQICNDERLILTGTAFEDLPDDWVCPDCGVGKEMLEPEED